MKTLILSLILISASSAMHAQNLTPAQKEADFRYLASMYSTSISGRTPMFST